MADFKGKQFKDKDLEDFLCDEQLELVDSYFNF